MRVIPPTQSTNLVSISSRIDLPSTTEFVLLDRAENTSLTNFYLSRIVSVGPSGVYKDIDPGTRSTSLQTHHGRPFAKMSLLASPSTHGDRVIPRPERSINHTFGGIPDQYQRVYPWLV
jgi:hypothetical protein